MDLEYLGQVLSRDCLSSLLTTLFFVILGTIVYALEKVMLAKVIGYIALVWFLITITSGLLALICCIWSGVFERRSKEAYELSEKNIYL